MILALGLYSIKSLSLAVQDKIELCNALPFISLFSASSLNSDKGGFKNARARRPKHSLFWQKLIF